MADSKNIAMTPDELKHWAENELEMSSKPGNAGEVAVARGILRLLSYHEAVLNEVRLLEMGD
jgi:hypothetical protein